MEADELERELGALLAAQDPIDVATGLEAVRRRYRRRRTRAVATTGGVLVAVAVVGFALLRWSGSRPNLVTTAPTGGSPASANGGCVSPPKAPSVLPQAVDQQAWASLGGGAIEAPVTLDGGSLNITPPEVAQRPSLGPVAAQCEILSAVTPNGITVSSLAGTGYLIGYGRVTIRPGLDSGFSGVEIANSDGYGAVQPTLPTTPPVYQSRLAWVVVFQDLQFGNCPAEGPSPTPRPTVAYESGSDDLVIVIDATTGGDALVYSPRQTAPCGGNLARPFVNIPARMVSVPWTLKVRAIGGTDATITAYVSSCDGYDSNAYNSPAEAQVIVYRPFGPTCGSAETAQLTLLPGKNTTLPPKIVHGPVGGYFG